MKVWRNRRRSRCCGVHAGGVHPASVGHQHDLLSVRPCDDRVGVVRARGAVARRRHGHLRDGPGQARDGDRRRIHVGRRPGPGASCRVERGRVDELPASRPASAVAGSQAISAANEAARASASYASPRHSHPSTTDVSTVRLERGRQRRTDPVHLLLATSRERTAARPSAPRSASATGNSPPRKPKRSR